MITAVTDPLGRTTRYAHDGAGNITTVVHPNGVTEHATYNAFGLPDRITGASGTVWLNTYDERGNQATATDPTGAVTQYTRDTSGNITRVTDGDGGRWHLAYDAAGLALAATDPAGRTTRCERDAFGRVISLTEPLGATTYQTWSAEGRPLIRTHPDGTTESWTWDPEGNLLAHTQPGGGVTRFETTHFGLPASRTTPDGARITFTHDTEMRLVRVVNAEDRPWEYAYDAAGQLISETDFNGVTTRYGHDAAGQLTSLTDGLGQVTRLTRDGLGNITEQRSPSDGTTPGSEATTFTYDDAGMLIRAVNRYADLIFVRDPLGRILAESCNGAAVTSTYDPLGRRTTRRTPAGVRSTWTWRPDGLPESLTTADERLDFGYDPAGRETERQLAGHPLISHSYDALGRTIAQSLTPGRTATAQHRTYAYRADGTLTSVTTPGGAGRRFSLDPVGRVTAVTGDGWDERYTYDITGKVTHASLPDVPADDGPRPADGPRVLGAGRVRYEYDGRGRVVVRSVTRLSRKPAVWHYRWDHDDRLTRVTTPDGTRWHYLHDPLGRRIAKQRMAPDGVTVTEETRFTWDGTHLAEQITRTAGASQAHTVTWDRDGTRPLTQTERTVHTDAPQDVINQQFLAIVTDLVGTPTELVDPAGHITAPASTTLWGEPVTGDGPPGTPLRFPGQYHDPETGLHYNYFRYYDPATARYLTTDPLGLEAGPDPYTYVVNPLHWLDYLGLLTCAQNAAILERNMAREGRSLSTGQAAAHLVPSGGSRRQWRVAVHSRALLDRYGIDINDPANGISLGHPRPHNFTHRGPFLNRLDASLTRVVDQGRAQGLGARAIRTALRQHLRGVGRAVQGELTGGAPGPGAIWTI